MNLSYNPRMSIDFNSNAETEICFVIQCPFKNELLPFKDNNNSG